MICSDCDVQFQMFTQLCHDTDDDPDRGEGGAMVAAPGASSSRMFSEHSGDSPPFFVEA